MTAIIKSFGDTSDNSRSANPKKLLSKPNEWLNLKKKDQYRSKMYLGGLSDPPSNASQRLIVKQKTIRALIDTG